jgi:hypothetical protein
MFFSLFSQSSRPSPVHERSGPRSDGIAPRNHTTEPFQPSRRLGLSREPDSSAVFGAVCPTTTSTLLHTDNSNRFPPFLSSCLHRRTSSSSPELPDGSEGPLPISLFSSSDSSADDQHPRCVLAYSLMSSSRTRRLLMSPSSSAISVNLDSSFPLCLLFSV